MRNVLLAVLSLMFITGCGNNDKTQKAPGANEQAQSLIKAYLDGTLNDAKSYEPLEFSKLYKLKDTVWMFDGEADTTRYHGAALISHTYRAKNAFGAYLKKTEWFKLDSSLSQVDCCFKDVPNKTLYEN